MKKVDIFSSQFSFYVDDELTRKRTLFGVFLTYITIIVGIAYLIYLSIQYTNNQIDPKFRTQSFVSEDQIDINLSQDLIGFRFEYLPNKYIEQLQQQQNKTYIVYIPVLFYQNMEDFQYYPLEIVNCTNPDLIGYNCLDFSNLQNLTLTVSTKMNFSSQIFILVYGCLDIDSVKTTIPNNCASQKEIDQLVNDQNTNLRLKLLTSQYNITSQKQQVNYRNQLIFTSGNLFIQTKLKAQRQTTQVKNGFLIQSQSTYASPINYDTFTQQFDKAYSILTSGVGPYIQVSLCVDELEYLTNIEFPIYPEVLAYVNSVVTLMMGIGYIARYFSQRLIKQQFFLLFLQNLFQDTYEQILEFSNILPNNSEVRFKLAEKNQHRIGDEFQDRSNNQQIIVPSLMVKSKLQLMDSQQTQQSPILTPKNVINLNELQDELLEDTESKENKTIYTEQKDLVNQKEKSEKQTKLSSLKIKSQQQTSLKNVYNKQKIEQKNISELLSQNLIVSPRRRQLNINISKRQMGKFQQTIFKSIGPAKQESRLCHTENSEIKEISNIFSKKIKFIFSEENFQIIKSKIFGRKQCINKQSSRQIDQSILKNIEFQINKNLDIFQLYKDIIFLKKAIMVLLTKDQLATLQLISCSPNPKSFNQEDNLNFQSKENPIRKNYFQEQTEIMESIELQSKYIKKFFSKFSKDNCVNEIDYRILTSIMKQEN